MALPRCPARKQMPQLCVKAARQQVRRLPVVVAAAAGAARTAAAAAAGATAVDSSNRRTAKRGSKPAHSIINDGSTFMAT